MNVTVFLYFPRQLSDLLLTRGAAMLAVGIMLTLPLLLVPEAAEETELAPLVGALLRSSSFFLIMLATYGIIGGDVRQGNFRFLFTKPIDPVLYYAQAFLIALIAFLAAELVLIGGIALVREPVWPGRALLDTTALFFLLGSMIFALSRVSGLDWIFGMLFIVLAAPVRTRHPASESFMGKVFNVLLPPGHLFDPALFSVDGVNWGHVTWVGTLRSVS